MNPPAKTAAPVPVTTQRRPGRLRVVMFVRNDVRRDARVLREARTLADAGHVVTIVGHSPGGDRETASHGAVSIVRVPTGRVPYQAWRTAWYHPWRLVGPIRARFQAAVRARPPDVRTAGRALVEALAIGPWVIARTIPSKVRARRGTVADRRVDDAVDWLYRWRLLVSAWARRAADAAPAADVWHAHDLPALPAALQARRRRGGLVVYDSHEIFVESSSISRRPRLTRVAIGLWERSMARHVARVVTVNDAVASVLRRRLGMRDVVVVHNVSPRWDPPEETADRLRRRLGLAADTPVALYHGGFSPERGLEELGAALLEPGLEQVHAVYLGYGPLEPIVRELARDPRFGGRVHVLDPVEPDEVLSWIADADVGVMAIHGSTLNHRLSTPNKLFECLAAGVPVVASALPGISRIVADPELGPLGVLCDPTDVRSVARAIAAILELPADERAALRARCRHAAHVRWNWETESRRLLELYDGLERRLPSGSTSGTRSTVA